MLNIFDFSDMGQPARNHGGTRGHGYRNEPRGVADSILFTAVSRYRKSSPMNNKVEIVNSQEFKRRSSGNNLKEKQSPGIVWKETPCTSYGDCGRQVR